MPKTNEQLEVDIEKLKKEFKEEIEELKKPKEIELKHNHAGGDYVKIKFNDLIFSDYIVRRKTEIQTTDDTQTTIDSIILLDENTCHAKAMVVGIKSDGTDRASYEIDVTAYRTGAGNATVQGTVTSLHTEESNPAWDTVFTVSGNNLRVSVTGVAATTIKWVCVMSYINTSK